MNDNFNIPKLNPADQTIIDSYTLQINDLEKYRLDYVSELGNSTLDKIKREVAEEVISGYIQHLSDSRDEAVVRLLEKYPEQSPAMTIC
ncbi:MAG: hypothetical protein IKH50_05000 [Oscillospiraceae bacterium]|nr:hypothetical protein [Oscillospiraceae bacterium]